VTAGLAEIVAGAIAMGLGGYLVAENSLFLIARPSMSCCARFDLDQCGTSASCTRHENTNGGATVIKVAPIWCLKIEILPSNRFLISAGEAACVGTALQTRLNCSLVRFARNA